MYHFSPESDSDAPILVNVVLLVHKIDYVAPI